MIQFQDFENIYDVNYHIRTMLENTQNLNNYWLDNNVGYLFNKPIYVNYIVEDYTCIKNFFIDTIQFFFSDKNQIDVNNQIIFDTPHEQINFKTRFKAKDRKLPLFILKMENIPSQDNLNSQFLYRMDKPGFMASTAQKTKKFIIDQYSKILEGQDPQYTKETIRNKIFPILYYDQVSSKQKVDMSVIQETNIELQTLFQNFNTKIFLNRQIKGGYLLQIDQLIRNSNDKLKNIQEKFYSPVAYLINYMVKWEGYSNITKTEKNEYNLQKQTYTFTFDLIPLTKFNLSGVLLRMDIDLGYNNCTIFEESSGVLDPVEWSNTIKLT